MSYYIGFDLSVMSRLDISPPSHSRKSGRRLDLISASPFYGVSSSARPLDRFYNDRRTSVALSTINYHDLFPGIVAQRLDLLRSSPTVKDTWRLVPSTSMLAGSAHQERQDSLLTLDLSLCVRVRVPLVLPFLFVAPRLHLLYFLSLFSSQGCKSRTGKAT